MKEILGLEENWCQTYDFFLDFEERTRQELKDFVRFGERFVRRNHQNKQLDNVYIYDIDLLGSSEEQMGFDQHNWSASLVGGPNRLRNKLEQNQFREGQ